MREYEILFITELNDALHHTAKEKVKEILLLNKSEIFYEEDHGLHTLAYPISKVSQGRFFFYHFRCNGDLISTIEKELRYETSILRFIIVRLEEVLNKKPQEDAEVKEDVEVKNTEVKEDVEVKNTEVKEDVEVKNTEVKEDVEVKNTEVKEDVEVKNTEV